jgi:antitoxin YefM
MGYVTFTDFRNNLATHLDKLEEDRVELIVTRQNRTPSVIMLLSEWEGMKETLHLLSTKANAERLLAAIADADAGRAVERDLIEP